MRYEQNNRIQFENYCCSTCLLLDVMTTLFNEDLYTDQINIISDTYTTEQIIKEICRTEIEGFDFDLSSLYFNKFDTDVDEYRITILNDGEVFVEPAINKDAEYHDCDGFIFVELQVSEDAVNGNNRNCDVIVFEID